MPGRLKRILFVVAMTGFGMTGLCIILYQELMPPLHHRFFTRAETHAAAGRWEDALLDFEKARSESALSDDDGALAIERRSMQNIADIQSLRLGDMDKAARSYWLLVEKFPGTRAAEYSLQRLYQIYRDFSVNCRLSLPFIQRYLKRYPTSPAAPAMARQQVRCLVAENDLAQARVEATAFLERYPGSDLFCPVMMDMGLSFFVSENYGDAKGWFDKVRGLESCGAGAQGEASIMAGRCLLESGHFDNAIELFKEIIKGSDNPGLVQVYLNAAVEARKRSQEQVEAVPERIR